MLHYKLNGVIDDFQARKALETMPLGQWCLFTQGILLKTGRSAVFLSFYKAFGGWPYADERLAIA